MKGSYAVPQPYMPASATLLNEMYGKVIWPLGPMGKK